MGKGQVVLARVKDEVQSMKTWLASEGGGANPTSCNATITWLGKVINPLGKNNAVSGVETQPRDATLATVRKLLSQDQVLRSSQCQTLFLVFC